MTTRQISVFRYMLLRRQPQQPLSGAIKAGLGSFLTMGAVAGLLRKARAGTH